MSVRDIVRLIYESFSQMGEVEDIYFNQGRFNAFIKYSHRYFAEFTKEAMHDQVLVEGVTDPIRIQWALESPFDKTKAEQAGSDVKHATQGHQSYNRRNNVGPQKEVKVFDKHKQIMID